jgi:hypothetical protein
MSPAYSEGRLSTTEPGLTARAAPAPTKLQSLRAFRMTGGESVVMVLDQAKL